MCFVNVLLTDRQLAFLYLKYLCRVVLYKILYFKFKKYDGPFSDVACNIIWHTVTCKKPCKICICIQLAKRLQLFLFQQPVVYLISVNVKCPKIHVQWHIQNLYIQPYNNFVSMWVISYSKLVITVRRLHAMYHN